MGSDGARFDAVDRDAIRYARVLPLDVVQANGSGHAGTAVGLVPFMYALFQRHLRHDPRDPSWPGRDRFVLSCGHTSLSLYLQLYLSGYGLEMDDLRATRRLGSATPGHPERGVTPGVETSTGPLGQGLANAVGMAMEARRIRTLLDPDAPADTSPFDHRIWCLASDGDIQEGLSHEAGALAGHLGLGRLVLVWDDNRISIDGPTGLATSEDVPARFAAYGWRVLHVDAAEDLRDTDAVLAEAAAGDGRPTFVALRSRIGHPMPHVGGTAAAHAGAPGAVEVAETKSRLDLDPDATFSFPDDVLTEVRDRARVRASDARREWEQHDAAWRRRAPDRVALSERLIARRLPPDWRTGLPRYGPDAAEIATRIASQDTLRTLVDRLPELWGGSADLSGTNGVAVEAGEFALADGPVVRFGVREHAMAGIANGIALAGRTRPFVATFLTFADYLRPALRMAALMGLPVTYVFSHDSLAVGEDGPTHQPVEHLWSYRAIPGLEVIRPADAAETVAAWTTLLERDAGPTAVVLSRQPLGHLGLSFDEVEAGVRRGGYVVGCPGSPEVLLLGTGAEVHVALGAAQRLAGRGVRARVVSLPCLERFDAQDTDYREQVLPSSVPARVSVEAGVGLGWHRYVGTHGQVVSVETYGASGNGADVLAAAGITVDAVVDAALESLSSTR